MNKKVLMLPSIAAFERWESGIKQVILNYSKYLPQFGWDVTSDQIGEFDLLAAHAGARPGADVAHAHGLYWSADYNVMRYEHRSNQDVTLTIRSARQVTVPSAWVAETIARDLRFMPHVVPHGIDWEDWQHKRDIGEYVLWNKNRNLDVCSPYYVGVLSSAFPNRFFVSTFAPDRTQTVIPPNVRVTGVLPHHDMKKLVQSAAVYLNTTKETFGIGILEAMASGVPVLAFDHGGASELIDHGVTGYLARPGNNQDLKDGLDYCFRYRDRLGTNAAESVKKWDWPSAVEKVARVYDLAMQPEPTGVSVIIPTYNYADKVERAIRSAADQTYKPSNIFVVDDGSTDDTEEVVKGVMGDLSSTGIEIRYIKQENAGVANARNRGISEARTKYICCLDADDAIKPQFLEACVTALEHEPTLGIAYTGLTYIKPDGETGLSPWPGEFDYDKQIGGNNQVPTCCVFRKKIWERLGGYRQRYAPMGAGSEDAEFWLRIGAYGWDAKKVTNAGLFVYSWMSGRVSGNPEYREMNWRTWHPWTQDNMHPFASIATPINGLAHPVRSYDEPEVSVVIPVGKGHEPEVINALDSLEAQTFRKWEAIVVWDSPGDPHELLQVYPYIRLVNGGGGGWGAGRSRNQGAAIARAPLLLYLDADDWLYPEAIEKMVDEFNLEASIIYTDYVGKAFIAKEDLSKIDNEILYYNDKIGEAVIAYRSAEYDCQRAVRQPDEKLHDTYIWNLITSLVPKEWHDEIGGFDEDMPSWEDWDYWIRLARAGRCFARLPDQLVVYRFYTGHRRETGLQSSKSLLEYMIRKKENAEIMACGCRGSKTPSANTVATVTQQSQIERESVMSQDKDLVLCVYRHPNRGDHKVIGPSTGIVYGYRGGGTRFYVHKSDVATNPSLFVPVSAIEEQKPKEEPLPPPPPPSINQPEPVEESQPFDLQTLPGVTPQIAMGLNAMGAHSPEDVLELGVTGLSRIKGIGKKRAEAIIAYVQQME